MATIQEAIESALRHHQAGRLQQAEQLYQQILAQQPDHIVALHYLGVIAHQEGRHDVAVDLIRQATVLNPNYPEALNNLGNALNAGGRIDEAIDSFRRVLALNPESPAAHVNLGMALHRRGQLDEAVMVYRQAISLSPDLAEAHANLGNAFKAMGQLDEAIASHRRALEIRPEFPGGHDNLGDALKDNGQIDEAIAAYRQAIALKPHAWESHHKLGVVLKEKGLLDEAADAYRKALALNPSNADAQTDLGLLMREKARLDDAIAAFQLVVALRPDSAEAQNNLGIALGDKGRSDEALAAFGRAVALNPNLPVARHNLGIALRNAGRLDEAIAEYRHAIALRPDYAEAYGSLVYAMHFHPACDARSIATELRNWEKRFAEPLRPSIKVHANDRQPDRRLRIGYISPDFRENPTGRFLLPLLTNHDRRRFEIFAYADSGIGDELTDRLRSYTDAWRSIVGLSDARVADLIRDDRIDILVDLTLQRSRNRLLVFARKPAPVQITYLAYPGSSGLRTMDYRLSDPWLDPLDNARDGPAGGDESSYSEQTFRLPETYWCYLPVLGVPPLPPPSLENGYITFGCLNNFCKLNDPLLSLWARLLAVVPRSRLMIHAHEGGHRRRVLGYLQQQGVEPSRVSFVGKVPAKSYFESYHSIDIALDTVPFGGGTTTCDALWMGVPVVSLAGKTAVGRGGLSILSNIGLPGLVARTPEKYVHIAARLAGDVPVLTNLRSILRQRMQASPLMDAPRFARGIEEAYRRMWRTWCGTVANSPEAQVNLGDALKNDGQLDEAIAAYRQAIALKPDVHEFHHKLGLALQERVRLDEAVDAYRQAIALNPNYAEAYSDLGLVLREKGQLGDAIAAFQHVVKLRPDSAEARNNLGIALGDKAMSDDALAAFRGAIALNPDLPVAHHNLGTALRNAGQLDEAIAEYRRAIALRPDYIEAHGSLLYAMLYHPAFDAQVIAEEHRAWDRRYAEPLKGQIKAHANDRSSDRPLRVGYVSPDFGYHPVGRFLLPLIKCHDQREFHVFCYSDTAVADDATRSFQSHAGLWRDITRMSDDAVAGWVREDRIDILIDLAGHTARNRMLTFARKPAPVQVSYLGYPGATGLTTIDYRLTDKFADPPGAGGGVHSEKPWHLPRTNWCFEEPRLSPPVNPPPVVRRGYVTFGSFNTLTKVTETMLHAWGRILGEVPGSRLFLKAAALGSENSREQMRRSFAAMGIDAGRLEFRGLVPDHMSHLALYGEMDIALDTFPYHGTTTTCDALWMGLPVITLAGTAHVSRVGVSLLSNVGLADLVTTTTDQYVGCAVALAKDHERLAALRLGMRGRMTGSSLMDAPSLARDIEAAYRRMWRIWCGSTISGP